MLPVAALGQSAPTTGVLHVTATIASGCRIADQLRLTQGIDFGTLDFGAYPSIFANALTAQSHAAMGTLQLTCVGIVSANVSIGTGLHASGNQRQLANGTHRVAYELYADSGFNLPFAGTTPRTVAVSPNGSVATVNLPIYGRVQPMPGGYVPGSYQDDVQITVSW
ncbi:MAG: spore coat U domain-containing protein [Gammaproteobacteria bacterium]